MKKFIVLLIAVSACTINDSVNEYPISLNVMNTFDEMEFSSIDFVPLETNEECFLGENVILKMFNNEIYALDNNVNICIFRFDNSGEYLNRIGKQGRGREEYLQIQDFTVSGDTIILLETYSNKSRILKYTSKGRFLDKFSIDIAASSIEKLDNGYILSSGYLSEFYEERLHIINEDGQLVESYIKDDTNFGILGEGSNLYKHNRYIYIHEVFHNNLYIYHSGSLFNSFKLEFDQYSIPNDVYSLSFMEAFMKLRMTGFAGINNYVENNEYAVITYTLQKQGEEIEVYLTIYDKAQEAIYIQKELKSNYGSLPLTIASLVSITEDNEIVMMINPGELPKDSPLFPSNNRENPYELKGLDEMSNPVLIFCKISL